MIKLPCEDAKERFWRQVNKTDNCWEWLGAKDPNGYGMFGIYYKHYKSHRISWHLAHGPILGNLFVLHKCDNPSCVNPSHLFLGTNSDNMKDMHNKQRGRFQHGECGVNAKLTWQKARAIRNDARSFRQIAEDYGVTVRVIHRIKHNKSWRVDKDPEVNAAIIASKGHRFQPLDEMGVI